MGKIQIKRGLQANVASLVLAEGEFAVALDTGNVYTGTTSGNIHVNPTGGTADEAAKLKTARSFSASGDAAASAVSFDGTADVDLVLTLANSGVTAGTYTKVTVDAKGRVTEASQIALSDISGLGSAAAKNTGTAAGNVVVVESNGKIAESLLPATVISETFEVATEAAMLALAAQKGDVCIRTDESKSYILAGDTASVLENWKWLKTPDCKVLSVNGKTGAVILAASDVGAETDLSTLTAKTSIADADSVVAMDSAADNTRKKITFTVIKAALKTYFDTLYNKYVHPTFTAKSSGLYKVTVDAEGHVSVAEAVAKADITALGIPAQDTVYALPTASASTLGGVKIGSGLEIGNGVVSVGDIDGGTF